MVKPTIGLEIHVQLATATKMFCSCANDPHDTTPNTNVCPVCMGHPGTLPVPNQKAIDLVLKTGIALECSVNTHSKFDRKNYFYPDLPKGYQITQYDQPLCFEGRMTLLFADESDAATSGEGTTVRIRRIHIEEDTGRLQHEGQHSLVDYNRAGVPLMELVTEPDFHSGEEASAFAQELQLTLRYLGVSDANMEKGQLRVEANISIRPDGFKEFGTKVEIKNLNSFKAVRDAVDYEIKRQS